MRILLQSQVSSNSNYTSINILYSIQYFIAFRHCNKICDKLSNIDKTIELFIRLSWLIIISMLSHSNKITMFYRKNILLWLYLAKPVGNFRPQSSLTLYYILAFLYSFIRASPMSLLYAKLASGEHNDEYTTNLTLTYC